MSRARRRTVSERTMFLFLFGNEKIGREKGHRDPIRAVSLFFPLACAQARIVDSVTGRCGSCSRLPPERGERRRWRRGRRKAVLGYVSYLWFFRDNSKIAVDKRERAEKPRAFRRNR